MKYHTFHSGYAGAVLCLEEKGGMMFPRRGPDGASTVVCGKNTYTFWEPESVNYVKCKLLAEDLGYPDENFTSGRLAKFILKDICGLDTTGTYVEPRILALARDGFHWHYTHVETGYHPYLLEFDLCAAYATTLVRLESFFFNTSLRTPTDNGSLMNLQNLLPTLPKWIRLVMIGMIASHRMTFATMPNRKNGDVLLKWNTIEKVSYGAAFNQVHRAILRLYRTMQRLHKIGGVHIKRMHTDSFALSVDCPTVIESAIFEYLEEQGYLFSCKGQGTAHFLSLNDGIIGRKFIGVPCEVREAIKSLPQRNRRVQITADQLQRWGIRGISADDSAVRQGVPASPPEQLELELDARERQSPYERFTA